MSRTSLLLLLASPALAVACGDAARVDGPPGDAGASDGASGGDARSRADVEDVTCERGDASVATPPSFAGKTNPIAAAPNEIAAGGDLFRARCALCHGAEGRGDGPEGPADPRPADLTALRRPDDYLFWRISEGGRAAPFCSAMPAFSYLTERARWQLVVYIKTLATPADAGPSDAPAD